MLSRCFKISLSNFDIYFHFIIEKFKIQAIFFIEYGFFNSLPLIGTTNPPPVCRENF